MYMYVGDVTCVTDRHTQMALRILIQVHVYMYMYDIGGTLYATNKIVSFWNLHLYCKHIIIQHKLHLMFLPLSPPSIDTDH